jgi:broad specificity phosphatase PhoE
MSRKALDGAERRRIYLLRHAETSYVDEQGNAIPDSRSVPLTARGREQADEMARMLAPIAFDAGDLLGPPAHARDRHRAFSRAAASRSRISRRSKRSAPATRCCNPTST